MAIRIGDRVRLTGEHLRNTGQTVGSAGLDRWTVTGIHRDWAITNEKLSGDWFTPEELAQDPTLTYRRIALANLERTK